MQEIQDLPGDYTAVMQEIQDLPGDYTAVAARDPGFAATAFGLCRRRRAQTYANYHER